jgi:homocysteine S-methyltransferase
MVARPGPTSSGVYLTDGGIETHLIFNMGEPLPLFSAFPLNDTVHGRSRIKDYYRDYLAVARQAELPFLFATDTWRASPDWAEKLGYGARALRRNNIAAADICVEMQEEFAAAGVASAIAGVVGPRRDAWKFDAAMTVAEAIDYHSPQIEAFALSRVEEVAAYTLTNTAEAIGIVRASAQAGLPVVISFTVETDGTLPGGKLLGQAIREVDEETVGVAAYYMINCAHPDHFARQLASGEAWTSRIGGLRANASAKSHAELDELPEIDVGDIDDFGRRHRDLLPAMANLHVIGGCCGTDHRHIQAICAHCRGLL